MNRIEFLVSAAGLEPATHALKESPNLMLTTTCTSGLLHARRNKFREMQTRHSSGCPEGVRDSDSERVSCRPEKTSINRRPFSFLSQNSLDYFPMYAIMVLHG
jgi:hypothetical protein